MALWTASEAAAATHGRATTDWTAEGVSIDTRTLAPGDLFVALKDVRDGHDFVAQALENGAAAALVSRVPEGVSEDAPLLIVEDVLTALEQMGRASRARTQAKVIGVTGSVGKTSTKEMLRACLQVQGKTHAAEKSYNNHWGVPLTLARMPQDSQFAVIEIGMNHPGEIAPLSQLARPDVAIITIVAPAHLEAFNSVEEIAEEKASIFAGLTPDGMAIVNGDLDLTPILTARAPGTCLTFGQSDTCDWMLLDATPGPLTTVCRARFEGQSYLFKIGAPGRHFAMNGLAALAGVAAVDGDIAQAILALGNWQPPAGRGLRCFIALDDMDDQIGIDLIDDAYNANPASIGAALDMLSVAAPSAPHGRRVAILGDMKELGPTEIELHRALARHPAMDRLDVVHCVGPLMRHLSEALPAEKRGLWAETSAELASRPTKLTHAGDVAMVKGSLSMKMAAIVDAISKLGEAVPKEDRENKMGQQ